MEQNGEDSGIVNECINDEQCRVKLLNEKEKIKN